MDPLASISTRQGYGGVEQSVAPAGTPGQPAVHTPAAAGTDSRRERQGIQLPDDRVSLSGQRPAAAQQQPAATGQDPAAEQTTRDGTSLEDPQIQQMVARLKQTEQKVKAHEAAHKAAGGNLASGASYSYTQGTGRPQLHHRRRGADRHVSRPHPPGDRQQDATGDPGRPGPGGPFRPGSGGGGPGRQPDDPGPASLCRPGRPSQRHHHFRHHQRRTPAAIRYQPTR